MKHRNHELKTFPEDYDAILYGRRRAVLRDSEDFAVDDILLFQEFSILRFTGRKLRARISEVIKNVPGIKSGYSIVYFDSVVVMS